MAEDPVQLVRSLFSQRLADSFTILADDVVFNSPGGHIYVGHEGFTQWYLDQVRSAENVSFADPACEHVLGGWVLVQGSVRSPSHDGDQEIEPGCWLVRVREDVISAALYFPTAEEARASLHT